MLTEKQKEVRVGLSYLILSLILSQQKITDLVRHDLDADFVYVCLQKHLYDNE